MVRGIVALLSAALVIAGLSSPAAGESRGVIVFSVTMPDGVGRGGDHYTALVQSQFDGTWQDPEATECDPGPTRCSLSLPPGRYRIGIDPSNAYEGESALEEWYGGVHPLDELRDQYLDDATVVDLAGNATADLGTIRLDLEGVVSGAYLSYSARLSVKSPRGPWVQLRREIDSTREGYAHRGLPPGDYRLSFAGSSVAAFEYWGTPDIHDEPASFRLGLSEHRTGMDPVGREPGSIDAAVRLPDGSAADVFFSLYFRQDGRWVSPPEGQYANPQNTAGGRASVEGLAPGDYRLVLERGPGRPGGDVADEVYPGAETLDDGTDIRVSAGRTTRLERVLRVGGHLRGRVVDPDGLPVADVPVSAVADVRGQVKDVSTAVTGPDGRYDIGSLGSRAYRVRAGDPAAVQQEHRDTFAGGAATYESAAAVDAVAASVRPVPDIVAPLNGFVSGRVLDASGAPLEGLVVISSPHGDNSTEFEKESTTDASGRWSLRRTRTGPYQLRLYDPTKTYREGYFDGTTTLDPFVPPPSRRAAIMVSPTASPVVTITARPQIPRVDGFTLGTRTSPEGLETQPRVGEVLTFTIDSVTPRTARTGRIQWTRDRVPIPGAEGPEYVIQPRDAGYDLGVQVVVTSLGVVNDQAIGLVGVAGSRAVDPAPVLVRPRISDRSPVVGQVLTVDMGRAVLGWQWYSSKGRIAGATRPTYRVSRRDLGHRLWVQSSPADPGLGTIVVTPTTRKVQRARPTVRLSARSTRPGRVLLTVRAAAPGLDPAMLDARVRISRVRSGSDTLRTTTMRDGRVRVSLTGQPSGRRTYYVSVLGVRQRTDTASSRPVKVTVR